MGSQAAKKASASRIWVQQTGGVVDAQEALLSYVGAWQGAPSLTMATNGDRQHHNFSSWQKDIRQWSTCERCEQPAARRRTDVRHVSVRFASDSLTRRPVLVRWAVAPVPRQSPKRAERLSRSHQRTFFYDLSKVSYGLELGVEEIQTQKRTKEKEINWRLSVVCFQRVREAHADRAPAEISLAVAVVHIMINAWWTQLTPDRVWSRLCRARSSDRAFLRTDRPKIAVKIGAKFSEMHLIVISNSKVNRGSSPTRLWVKTSLERRVVSFQWNARTIQIAQAIGTFHVKWLALACGLLNFSAMVVSAGRFPSFFHLLCSVFIPLQFHRPHRRHQQLPQHHLHHRSVHWQTHQVGHVRKFLIFYRPTSKHHV